MVIARGNSDGDELLILGLSNENLHRMCSGAPIVIRKATHGDGVPEGWQIVLFHGKDEASMAETLRQAGVVGKETKINADPRLGVDPST